MSVFTVAPDKLLASLCSIRALYGSDGTKNATHGSANSEDAARELAFFFPDPITQASNAQATKDAAAFKSFLQDKLQPALAQGLAALAQLHKKQGSLPGSPVSWLGQWLLDNDPNKVRLACQLGSGSFAQRFDGSYPR